MDAEIEMPRVRRISHERIERFATKYADHLEIHTIKAASRGVVGLGTIGALVGGLWWFLDKKDQNPPQSSDTKKAKERFFEEYLSRSTGWGYIKHSLIKDVGVVTLVALLMQGVNMTWKSLIECFSSTFSERCAENILRRLSYATHQYYNTLDALKPKTADICGIALLESYNSFIAAFEHALAWHRLHVSTDEQAQIFDSLKTLIIPLNGYADHLERVLQSGWDELELKKCILLTKSLLGPWMRTNAHE